MVAVSSWIKWVTDSAPRWVGLEAWLNGPNVQGGWTMRHDVDHSLEAASRLGAWEAQQGIPASFFLLRTAS